MSESALVRKITYAKTKRNVINRWNEPENPNKDSEPAKHLFQNIDYFFQWKVLMSAPANNCKRKNLEAFFIAVKHPTLNEKKRFKEANVI